MIKKAPLFITEKTASMKSFMKYKLEVCILNDWWVSWAVDGIVEQGEPGPSEQENRAKHTKLEENFVNSFDKNSSEEINAAEVEHQKYKLERVTILGLKEVIVVMEITWNELQIFIHLTPTIFCHIYYTSVPSEGAVQ